MAEKILPMPLQDQIATEWNACIAAAGVVHPITLVGTDISVTANTVTTAGTFRPDLPDLGQFFFGNFFPQNSGPEYHHFTPPESFRGIIASGKIRLSAVLKRFSEEEFRPFYDDHEIDGYKKRLEAGVPMEQRFVRDTFFWSLTSPNLDAREEQNMWDCFAGQDGVRLVFSITDVHTDLRRVYYPTGTKNIPLLKQMMGVACRSDKFLVFNGLSKMGFFYLPRMFKPENETRLLIKRDRAKDLACRSGFIPTGTTIWTCLLIIRLPRSPYEKSG